MKLGRIRARAANERGRALADQGRDDLAERAYLEAIELDRDYDHAWFNLGLIYKGRRDWTGCARCNLRACELSSSPGQPAWWNLGIAATALHDWPTARRAWRGYGLEIPDGDGPIEASFGPTPIRLRPGDSGEVVWCRRIDPARAVIQNIPLSDSGRRHRDIVLHDGAPNGERLLDERVVPVFDELELWQSSGISTVTAQLTCPEEEDAEAVNRLFRQAALPIEDWRTSVRTLCRACSEGRPHEAHNAAGEAGWQTLRSFGFAGDLERVTELLTRWASAGSGREVSSLEVAIR